MKYTLKKITLIFTVFVLSVSCGQNLNPDPHRKGQGKTNANENNYSPSSVGGSVFCKTAIIGQLQNNVHPHSVTRINLADVQNEKGGEFNLLAGDHGHSFSISAGEMGILHRKREIITQDNQGHFHNLSLKCLQ